MEQTNGSQVTSGQLAIRDAGAHGDSSGRHAEKSGLAKSICRLMPVTSNAGDFAWASLPVFNPWAK